MTFAARSTDQCRCSATYSTARARSANGKRSRATTRAIRFASEPPVVSTPLVLSGSPSHWRNQSRAVVSTWAGPDASSHTPAKKLAAAVSQSPSTDGKLGAPGTNARNRGWLVRNAYGSMRPRKSAMISANGRPSAGGDLSSNGRSSAGVAVRPIDWSGSVSKCSKAQSRTASAAARKSSPDGCGRGKATARLSSSRRSSIRMDLLEVVGDRLVRDVPLAIVASGHFGVTLGAEQRPAVEDLLQPPPLGLRSRVDVQRQRERGPAPVARVLVVALDDRLVMGMQPARNDTGPGTQRAFHGELGQDRLADELALVLELAEELGEVLFHFEGDDLGLLRLPGHEGYLVGAMGMTLLYAPPRGAYIATACPLADVSDRWDPRWLHIGLQLGLHESSICLARMGNLACAERLFALQG